ncbi:MAG TPA: hypothetical protein V6D10_15285 [Trichocoleus sp.]
MRNQVQPKPISPKIAQTASRQSQSRQSTRSIELPPIHIEPAAAAASVPVNLPEQRPANPVSKNKPQHKAFKKRKKQVSKLAVKAPVVKVPKLQIRVPQFAIKVPQLKVPQIPVKEHLETIARVSDQMMPPQLRDQPWRWSIVWLAALCAFGGVGTAAFFWLSNVPSPPDCQTVTRFSSGIHRLSCAQEKARSGKLPDLVAAMALVQSWSEKEPLYQQVQSSIADWSNLILIAAREKMQQSDLKGAIEAAGQIPASSPVYKEAQAAIGRWQQQWQKGEAAYQQAQEALKAQNWTDAANQVTELNSLDHEYWRVQQADKLSQRIMVERLGWQALTKAQKMAKSGYLYDLGQAIAQVQDISPDTYAWKAAQADLIQWSQAFLNLVMQQWQRGDISGALASAQQIPIDLPLPSEARDLVRFSHAQKQVTNSLGAPKLDWGQVFNLMEGISMAKQIPAGSSLSTQAQASQQLWQAQLQDAIQLRIANLFASAGQQSSLQMAIEQANQLSADRPGRAQADALISQWQQQIEKLQDQPYLEQAQALAATNTIAGFQQAIEQANQIPAGRAARQDAQILITQWQQQIQILEDQPILAQANLLAKAKQYQAAIQVVQQLLPTRPLYLQAQQAIETWKAKIRSLEAAADQKILDRANAFAAKGDLTGAIATAAEITPGRVMYLEAQGAIGQWLEQRDGTISTEWNDSGDGQSDLSPVDDNPSEEEGN